MSEGNGPRQPSGVGIALFGRTFMLTGVARLVFLAFLVTLLIVLLPGSEPAIASPDLGGLVDRHDEPLERAAPEADGADRFVGVRGLTLRHQLMPSTALLLLFVRFPGRATGGGSPLGVGRAGGLRRFTPPRSCTRPLGDDAASAGTGAAR